MPNTFELIASSTVGAGGAASIDFTSIPSTFTDLCLKYAARSTGGTLDIVNKINFNSSTSGYSDRYLEGTGSATSSGANVYGGAAGFAGEACGSTTTANTFSNVEIYIPNYAGSNNKSYSVDSVLENNATATRQHLIAGLWSNSSAITSLSLVPNVGSFAQYTTAYLYGVKNA